MSGDLSLTLLAKAGAPAFALVLIGIAWISWARAIEAIPATLLSLGLALLALVLAVVVAHGFPNMPSLEEPIVLLAVPLIIYAATLVALVRRADISAAKAGACGLAGLVPLYLVGGYVLVNSACSLGRGGC